MILFHKNAFLLQTQNTSYLFHVLPSGHLEHLYYGHSLTGSKTYKRLTSHDRNWITAKAIEVMDANIKALSPNHFFQGGNMITYSDETDPLCLENRMLEMSSFGKGDIREPFVEITYPDGSATCDFLYDSYVIKDEIEPLNTLPSAYDDTGISATDHAQQLIVNLLDKQRGTVLELIYSVFPDCDAIVKSSRLTFKGVEGQGEDASITVERLMSNQIDFYRTGLDMTSFHGRWADEMHKTVSNCRGGKVVNEELAAGESGSRSNPFVMISDSTTTQDNGNCYGFNLIYSGNHYEALSCNYVDISRFVSGIQPTGFAWKLKKGESLESPQSVMTFSRNGFNGMSHHMHDFVRKHIVRGKWRDKERPTLINSWEASYFNITQASLLSLAKAAKQCGIELFVMDDGWFGHRNDDKSSLGDWTVNSKKLPNGIAGLAEKINDLGMMFGIWVEPEMVNEDSDLYRAHPDWAVKVPGMPHSKGRNQMNLDLTRKEVQDYVIDSMSKVFGSGHISYVKWDMNRIFSDRFSVALPADKQSEFMHRYYIGLYRIMGELTERFPDILFEGCSAGGNRFDLGILSYFPQIWGSDDTDPVCRESIQHGYSYGYPVNTIGAHVSASPNHQTLNVSNIDTRFIVACFGCLGYELNLCDLSDKEKNDIKEQVEFYKKWRQVLQFGDYYRLEDGRCIVVSKDSKKAVEMVLQKDSWPNRDSMLLKTEGLDNDTIYHMTNFVNKLSVKDFGSLINTMTPVHVKENSMLQKLADRFVNMSGEKEDITATGGILNESGVFVKSGYGGTGYNGDTRIMRTNDARLYTFEAMDELYKI
ncbi:MAG: alpha-galactosidase [Butyrivibrio sp.]|nr:alpha-galactosidase [Butyrivibrio sp.]